MTFQIKFNPVFYYIIINAIKLIEIFKKYFQLLKEIIYHSNYISDNLIINFIMEHNNKLTKILNKILISNLISFKIISFLFIKAY